VAKRTGERGNGSGKRTVIDGKVRAEDAGNVRRWSTTRLALDEFPNHLAWTSDKAPLGSERRRPINRHVFVK
jgi:hypothetical protein